MFETLEPRLALDSTVVFNELMYHPAGDAGDSLEWIELYNQMAVDMDLSGWQLEGGADFDFAEGTIVPGGGFLVLAADPAALEAATGFAGSLGPIGGRLSNGGESLRLVTKTDRVMDELDYGDSGRWPAGPDGSGATLAKLDPDSATAPAENWRTSAQLGGTPGARNFPTADLSPVTSTLVPLDAEWNYEDSGTDLGTAWRQTAFNDNPWDEGQAALYFDPGGGPVGGGSVSGTVTADNHFAVYAGAASGTNLRLIGRDVVSDWTTPESYNFNVNAGEHIYLAAWEGVGDNSTQMLIGQFNLPDGSTLRTALGEWDYVLGPNGATPGAGTGPAAPAVGQVASVIAGAEASSSWATPQAARSRFEAPWGSAVGGTFSDPTQFIWADSFSGNSITNQLNTYALYRSAEPIISDLRQTELAAGRTTYYFRTEFEVTDDPSRTQLTLQSLVDDGAVFYLNGDEIHRQNLPGGAISYNTPASAEVAGTAVAGAPIIVSRDSLTVGTNVLAVEVHQAVSAEQDVLFAAELTATVTPPDPNAPPTLVINEIAPGGAGFWVELANPGQASQPLGGYVISASGDPLREYVLPAESLAAGAVREVSAAELGFDVFADDRLFIYSPGRATVVDARPVDTVPRGRSAELGGRWLYPTTPTPGGANHFDLHDEIVINEIMYHHRPLRDGDNFVESPEEWIELYNRSAQTVDLSLWRLDEAVRYTLPPDTMIGAGEYLVVARDATALALKYPAIDIVGNFSGSLNDKDDRIRLRDAAGNPADEVHYFDDGRWPYFADGGGASLELRDADADNSLAESWAASDDAGQSTWQTYTYRGFAQASPVGPDSQWREFVIGLLDSGEVLLDDISVIERPGTGSAVQFIQNGSFQSGAGSWRLLGNHRHSEVITDPDDPGNQVLRLVGTGPTEHMHNHVETTLAGGRSVINGREYEISFRAKWIGGSNQFLTRLYFNRLPKVTLIDQPALHGTPGAANSTAEANIGPSYRGFGHSPAVPDAGQVVTVSVEADDPDGVSAASMRLWYSVNGGAWTSMAMAMQSGDTFTGTIPGQSSASIVQFYVQGSDTLGATSTFPAAARDSRALYKVQDNQASSTGDLHNFRIIVTPADSAFLHTDVQLMSNDRIGATVIYNEQEVFYDVGVRLKGSERGRVTQPRLGFNLRFHPDQLFRGVHETLAIDRSEGVNFGQREMLIDQMMTHAGGIPAEYNDLIHVIAPQNAHTGSAQLQLARFDRVFLSSQFDGGNDGTLFEYELIYYPTSTDGAGFKRPQPDNVVRTEIRDLGNDQENYRWNFLIKNTRDRDDYSALINFAKTFSLTGTAFRNAVGEVIDVDQWMRSMAFASLSGAGDQYFDNARHNGMFYVRPDDGRVLYFPHDLDFSFSATRSIFENQDLSDIITVPAYRRLYYGHLRDVIATTYNLGYMTQWANHFTSLLPGQNFAGHLSFIGQRSSFVSGQLAGLAPQVDFEITTSGGNDFSVDAASATLTGDGWINVRELRLAGSNRPLEVNWTGLSTWEVTVPLAFGPNPLVIEAYDYQGALIATDSITVTSTEPDRPIQDGLRITEIMYNPPDPRPGEEQVDHDEFEFIELQNISGAALSLTGVRLTRDITFDFTSSAVTSLDPGEFVVVVRNQPAFISRYGTSGINIAGQYENRLGNGGEPVTLVDDGGAIVHDFEYGDSWHPVTDGDGFSLVVRDAGQSLDLWDSRFGWRPSERPLGNPGQADSGLDLGAVAINEALTHTDAASGDWIELLNTTAGPVDIGHWFLTDDTGAVKYRFAPQTEIPAGEFLLLTQQANFGIGAPDPGSLVGFGLSELGEVLQLVSADAADQPGGYRDEQQFGAAERDVTFGRYVNSAGAADFAATVAPTPGAANAPPRVGPVAITEIMYHPASNLGVDEFIELRNTSGSPVEMFDPAHPENPWAIGGGVQFLFPASLVLAPSEVILVVGDQPAAFRSRHGIPADVRIFGPFAGDLSNDGERVEILRPGEPELDPLPAVPMIVVERVDYNDKAPWDEAADGGGASLHRLDPNQYANDPARWAANFSGGTPGDRPLRVSEVLVSGTNWSPAFVDALDRRHLGSGGFSVPGGADQLAAIPWLGVDRISVRFSDDAVVESEHLVLAGVNVADYGVVDFQYDPATRTATWTLDREIRTDRLAIDVSGDVADASGRGLDGNWIDGADSFPSGDSRLGPDDGFRFALGVLPGDVDGREGVSRGDVVDVVLRLSTAADSPRYDPRLDVNTDGVINVADLRAVLFRYPGTLPTGSPPAPQAAPPTQGPAEMTPLASTAAPAGGEAEETSRPSRPADGGRGRTSAEQPSREVRRGPVIYPVRRDTPLRLRTRAVDAVMDETAGATDGRGFMRPRARPTVAAL